MVKQVIIVGGGTAGWLTAAYLAKTLGAVSPGGVRIRFVESADIGILGVGEDTFPSMQRTLHRLGLDEGDFLRDSSATFKQGTHFVDWQNTSHDGRHHQFFHPFQSAHVRQGLDLLPYWLLGLTPGVPLDEAATVQKRVADASRAPKRITDADYDSPLNYAYHVDAARFAKTLRACATKLGVTRIVDTVDAVNLDENGAIESLTTREHGVIEGDLYIDCTGLRAQLIGRALRMPYRSCQSSLFCDRAVAMQVPYERPDSPIASYTISTAHEAGWTWDIGLDTRRGVGYVYSSAHTDCERAQQVLRDYVGRGAHGRSVRTFAFEAGYRETSWYKNCVAVGLAAGFFEPLEATGIVFIEAAANLLAELFPWDGEFEAAAGQFNRITRQRYERAHDFLKMHYCLSQRRDSSFWRDNVLAETIPDSLKGLLERWHFRPPDGQDFDLHVNSFGDSSWQFVLYGMGYKTDLSAQAGAFRHHEQARKEFAKIGREAARAAEFLPSHRELIDQVYQNGFARSTAG